MDYIRFIRLKEKLFEFGFEGMFCGVLNFNWNRIPHFHDSFSNTISHNASIRVGKRRSTFYSQSRQSIGDEYQKPWVRIPSGVLLYSRVIRIVTLCLFVDEEKVGSNRGRQFCKKSGTVELLITAENMNTLSELQHQPRNLTSDFATEL